MHTTFVKQDFKTSLNSFVQMAAASKKWVVPESMKDCGINKSIFRQYVLQSILKFMDKIYMVNTSEKIFGLTVYIP